MTVSEEVEGVLHRAFAGASEAGHAIIAPEHMALEIIVEEEIAAFLERCGTDLVAVESRLREHLGRIEPGADAQAGARPDAAFQHIVASAIQQTEADRREHVMLRDLFLALIDERGSIARAAILDATREPRIFEELRT